MSRTTKYTIHAAMRGTNRTPTIYRGDKPKKPAKKKAAAKKKTADPEKPKQPEVKETIQAPHVFSPEEIATKNVELRGKLDEIETLEDQKKSANADFKLRIDNAKNVVKQLRNKLAEGSEPRTVEARVEFDTKAGKKKFTHPNTGEFIREEDMTPADWQLPMFKPAPDGKGEQIAKPGETDVKKGGTPKPAAAPKSSPAGETNVGDALDKVASETVAPKIVIDLTKEDWKPQPLTSAFTKAATAAGWSKPQISALKDRLKEAPTVEAMMDTIRPHAIAPAAEPSTAGDGTKADDDFPM